MRGFPRSGRQIAHPADWPLSELWKHIHEILSKIDIQAPACFHDGRDGGELRSCFRSANVQLVLTSEYQRMHRTFATVIDRLVQVICACNVCCAKGFSSRDPGDLSLASNTKGGLRETESLRSWSTRLEKTVMTICRWISDAALGNSLRMVERISYSLRLPQNLAKERMVSIDTTGMKGVGGD